MGAGIVGTNVQVYFVCTLTIKWPGWYLNFPKLFIQGVSVNWAILQHYFFVVRQHWGGCRYCYFAANFKVL
jgi:hypothetical protein